MSTPQSKPALILAKEYEDGPEWWARAYSTRNKLHPEANVPFDEWKRTVHRGIALWLQFYTTCESLDESEEMLREDRERASDPPEQVRAYYEQMDFTPEEIAIEQALYAERARNFETIDDAFVDTLLAGFSAEHERTEEGKWRHADDIKEAAAKRAAAALSP